MSNRHHFTSKDLLIAASAGDAQALRELLAKGVNVNSTDQSGMTALILTAFQGHLKCVELLLLHGADVNLRTTYGMTPLKAATSKGHQSIVKVLQIYKQLQQQAS